MLLALVLGGAVGAIIAWVVLRYRHRPEVPTTPNPREIPAGVSEMIQILRTTAIVVGPDGEVIQSSSPARTFGMVRGTRVIVPQIQELIYQVRADGRIRVADLEMRRGSSPAIYLTARVAPLGELIVVLAEDRTTARRVEETRRDFVANVSHELKTPIGAIQLLSEAVEDAADDPEAVLRFASRMQRESHRLGELVGQIIDLSRLQSDNPLLRAEPVDIDRVLARAVDGSRVKADRRGITLVLAGERGTTVLGDAQQLGVAVQNLVENAVIYSEPNTRVTVATRRTSDGVDPLVEISVSDNGIGIPAQDLQRIFERFYRVDYARSRANGGTGLGLAIVKHIVAAHGGQVNVWSKVGQGSTFTIQLPYNSGEPVADHEEAGDDGAAADNGASADHDASRLAAVPKNQQAGAQQVALGKVHP